MPILVAAAAGAGSPHRRLTRLLSKTGSELWSATDGARDLEFRQEIELQMLDGCGKTCLRISPLAFRIRRVSFMHGCCCLDSDLQECKKPIIIAYTLNMLLIVQDLEA